VSELHRETKDFHDADAVGDGSAHSRATVRAVLALLTYQGYAFSILGVSAPFIAKGFALDQSGIAQMFAWISVNAFGALFLSRMADRIGRRRVLLISLVITPVCLF
jgi:MFS family permease